MRSPPSKRMTAVDPSSVLIFAWKYALHYAPDSTFYAVMQGFMHFSLHIY